MGSLLYFSPEDWQSLQTRSELLPLDYPRDLWALGIVLYSLASGGLPVEYIWKDGIEEGCLVGIKLRPKNGDYLGPFFHEINGIIHEKRLHRPSVFSLQGRMYAILQKIYQVFPAIQSLTKPDPFASHPTARWIQEASDLETFLNISSHTKTSGGTILDLIASYLPS